MKNNLLKLHKITAYYSKTYKSSNMKMEAYKNISTYKFYVIQNKTVPII